MNVSAIKDVHYQIAQVFIGDFNLKEFCIMRQY